jgi:hypothetical protein
MAVLLKVSRFEFAVFPSSCLTLLTLTVSDATGRFDIEKAEADFVIVTFLFLSIVDIPYVYQQSVEKRSIVRS